jgi:hypothetical protein
VRAIRTRTGTRRPSNRRRASRGLAAAAVALLAAVSLTACNPDQPGAAAIVDGNVISTSSLQSAARSYLAIVPNADRAQVQQRILERMILSRVIAKAARENDVRVSIGTVAAQLDKFYETTKNRRGLVTALASQQTPIVVPPVFVDQWVRDQLLVHKIVVKLAGSDDPASAEASARGSSTLSATAKTMKIQINPRYGTWNPNRGIEAQVSGGLARTAQQLNAQK